MKNSFWNWLLVILSSIGLMMYLVLTEGSENITRMFRLIDYRWVALAMASTLLFWVFDALVLHLILHNQSRTLPFGTCFRSSLIGMLFGLITPLQSGNIAAQVVVLKQHGLESGDAIAVMLVKNIIMVVSSVMIMSTAAVVLGASLYRQSPVIFWVVVLSLFLNLLSILGMIVAGIREDLIRRFVLSGVKLLAKLRILKNPERISARITVEIGRLHVNFMTIRQRGGMVARGMLLGIIGLMGSYQIIYFIYRGFGLAQANYVDVVAGQVFSMTIQSIVPLPGGAGITDSGFYFILISLFTKAFINFALIFWRFFTFYLPILAGMFALAGAKKKLKTSIA